MLHFKRPKKTLRSACAEAMIQSNLTGYGLLMDRIDGNSYAAVYVGDKSVAIAMIPDRYANTICVGINIYKQVEGPA